MTMKNFTIHRCASAQDLAQSAAGDWLKCRTALESKSEVSCLALSGGRLAPLFFSALTAALPNPQPVTEPLHFFWADERCVPPDSPDSNFLLAQNYLFLPWGISSARVHRIPGELPPELAVRQARQELLRWAPLTPSGLPRFDTIFLGMGEDGHVASLFPGQDFAATQPPPIYKAVRGPKPPPDRITLEMPVLAAAKNVWVLISGPDKQPALQQSLQSGPSTPLGHLLQQRPQTRLYIDFPLE